MVILYENRYYTNKKIIAEYVNKVLCKKNKICEMITFILSAIMLVITIVEEDFIISAIFGVCLVISVVVTVITPILTIKQIQDVANRINNGKHNESIVQFSDSIKMFEGTFSLSIEYSQIIKTYDLENSYVLMFGKNNGIILKKDSFVIGTFWEFKSFITSKCDIAR